MLSTVRLALIAMLLNSFFTRSFIFNKTQYQFSRHFVNRAVTNAGDVISAVTGIFPAEDFSAVDSVIAKLASTPDERISMAARMDSYYLPVFRYIESLRRQRHELLSSGEQLVPTAAPLFVAISAPQGCGKTTLCSALQELFAASGRTCVVASLDDFYLTGEEQSALAARHSDNLLLQYRGNAGTHDLELMGSTLRQLREGRRGVRVPVYDKSLRQGRGDRADPSLWTAVPGRADVVVLEGWMLGFRPLPAHSAAALPPDMREVNRLLAQYAELHELFDAWVVLGAEDVQGQVFRWRLEAERRMRAARGADAGLSDEQVRDFVSRFLPAYDAYLPTLRSQQVGPARRPGTPVLEIEVSDERRPVHATLRS